MPSQIGYFDTLKSVAGKVFSYLASITLTGTDGKTITCTENTTLNSTVPTADLAPKASPVFTGDVFGKTAGQKMGIQNPTNTGFYHVGGDVHVTMQDNETSTFNVGSGVLFTAVNSSTGIGGAFFAGYLSATVTIVSDPNSGFVATDTDTGKIAIFKSASSLTVSIKNYTNGAITLIVNGLGVIAAATAPA